MPARQLDQKKMGTEHEHRLISILGRINHPHPRLSKKVAMT
jgi:hypothetical protein